MCKELNKKIDTLTEQGSRFEKQLDVVNKQVQKNARRTLQVIAVSCVNVF